MARRMADPAGALHAASVAGGRHEAGVGFMRDTARHERPLSLGYVQTLQDIAEHSGALDIRDILGILPRRFKGIAGVRVSFRGTTNQSHTFTAAFHGDEVHLHAAPLARAPPLAIPLAISHNGTTVPMGELLIYGMPYLKEGPTHADPQVEETQQALALFGRLVAGTVHRLDGLTALPKAESFHLALANSAHEAVENGNHFSLVFIDLNDFKPVNDRYGHPAGDKLLQQFVAFLQDHLRTREGHTDVVSRYGGDEFVLLFPGVSYNVAKGIAVRLLLATEVQTFPVVGADGMHDVSVRFSFGVSDSAQLLQENPALDDASLAGGMLSRADQDMYARKAAMKAVGDAGIDRRSY